MVLFSLSCPVNFHTNKMLTHDVSSPLVTLTNDVSSPLVTASHPSQLLIRRVFFYLLLLEVWQEKCPQEEGKNKKNKT